jgi:asparagine synthase (glutamine-hydrolysing)
MCGIWASVGFALQEEALARVAHRGPDGEGWARYSSAAGPVCLGHRRLAISSLAQVVQPLTDAAGRWCLTYNGEIFNRAPLERALNERGFACAGHSDTSLVLLALSAFELAAPERLEGMFAFAAFNPATGRLIAARDRFGIKPLYVWRSAHRIALASEIKQFLAVPQFRARLNVPRARDFLELGLTDHTADTLWQDVSIVPPGEALILDLGAAGTLSVRRHRWYRPPEGAVRPQRPYADRVAHLAQALCESIADHVPNDVPTAVSLSGGLDSSAIAGLSLAPLPCFSLVHEDPSVDESRFAQSVATHLDRRLIPVRLAGEELPEVVASVVRQLDEPFPSMSVVAQWALFRAARAEGIRVMLTGQGADELLGGYPFLLGPLLASLLRGGQWRHLGREVLAQRRLHGKSCAAQLGALAATLMPSRWLKRASARSWCDPQLARARLAIARGNACDRAAEGLAAFRHDLLGAANLSMLLRYEDRTAMAHGIEARPPFLDRRVVEAALEFSAGELVAQGIAKRPLREAAASVLPADVLARTDKRGFPTPEAAWLKGPLAGYVSGAAEAAHARFPELVPHAALAGVGRVLAEPGPLSAPIWRIGALGAWAQTFGVGP